MVVHFSTTQPYAHAAGVFDKLDAEFWTTRGNVGLSRFTINAQTGGPATPLFSGVLRTATGHQRLVQISATAVTVSPRQKGIALFAVSAELHGWKWVFSGNPKVWPSDDTWFGSFTVWPTPFREVVIMGGKLNASDPSEVDVNVVLNDQPAEIPFHVVDVLPTATSPVAPRPSGRVVMAAPLNKTMKHFPTAGASWIFYDWPYTGKP